MQAESPRRPRLNPFAFPAETNVRFTLLVAAALLLAFSLGNSLVAATGLAETPEGFEFSVQPDELRKFSPEDFANVRRVLGQSFVGLALPGGLMLGVLVLANAVFRGHPDRIRRRKQLQPLTPDDDAQFFEALQELAAVSGVSPLPSIEVGARSRTLDGQAFGLRKRYALRLGGGLRLLLRKAPHMFRAIVLHELGHIANRDVVRTYFAQALWVAVVILGIIPMLVLISITAFQSVADKLAGGLTPDEVRRFFTLNLPTILILLFQFAATLGVVAAIRASLLRVREVYADWRAAQWGAEAALSDILRRNTSADESGRWSRLWRLHPSAQERLSYLQDPGDLFRLNPEVPLFAGILLGILLYGVTNFGVSLWLSLSAVSQGVGLFVVNLAFDIPPALGILILQMAQIVMVILDVISFVVTILAPAVGAAYLVAGTVGLQVQRETLAGMTQGRRGCASYLRLWGPAALVAIGNQIGYLITPLSILSLLPELVTAPGGLVALLLIPLWVAGATIPVWLWLVYARYFIPRTLGASAGTAPPQRARRTFTIVLSAMLAALLVPSVIGQLALEDVANSFTGDVPSTIEQLQQGILLSLGIALALYVALFGLTWLVVQARSAVRQTRCPACEQRTQHKHTVGETCEHCGAQLAPWLFAEGLPQVESA